MTILTVSLPSFFSGSSVAPQNVTCVRSKSEMLRIAAGSIVAEVVEDWYVFAFTFWYRFYEIGVHKPMNSMKFLIYSYLAVPVVKAAAPLPATVRLEGNLAKNSIERLSRKICYNKPVHNTSITQGDL